MMIGVLNGVLPLGDIRDVEKLCDRIVAQATRSDGLTPHDREDLVAFLVSEAWLLSRRYDPAKAGAAKFSNFAIPQLRMRIIDWRRRKTGMRSSRSEGRRQQPGEWGMLSTGVLDDGELERSLGSGDGDDPFARVSDFLGAVAAGGGSSRGVVAARRGVAPRRVA